MTMTVYTPAQLFAELPARRFEDYESFEAAFVGGFNAHRFEFPNRYGWRDALSWGIRHGVVRRQGREVLIEPGDQSGDPWQA